MVGFGPHCFTLTNSYIYSASTINQCISPLFQAPVTGVQQILNKPADDNPLPGIGDCNLSKLIKLLRNLSLKDDTLIVLKNYDGINLYLTASINK